MQKIKSTSHILHLFFRTLCWILPLATTYLILFHLERIIDWGAWASIIPSVHISAKYSQTASSIVVNAAHYFSIYHRLAIVFIHMIPLSITILICHKLASLFHLYEQGSLFEEENIRLIKHISICMILGELLQLIYQPLMAAALTFDNPPGERFASITLGTTNASTIITAFIILVASWIIKEAHQLKSDSQLTI